MRLGGLAGLHKNYRSMQGHFAKRDSHAIYRDPIKEEARKQDHCGLIGGNEEMLWISTGDKCSLVPNARESLWWDPSGNEGMEETMETTIIGYNI